MKNKVLFIHSEIPEISDKVQMQSFEKEVCKIGEWMNPNIPGEKFVVSQTRMEQWVTNFKAKLFPEGVPITLTHEGYADPMKTVGFMEDLKIKGDSLIAKMNVMVDEVSERVGKTIRGSSIGLLMNYIDPADGSAKGETIFHIALTNDPHMKGLDEFKPILASRSIEGAVMFECRTNSQEVIDMTELEQIKKDLEAERAKNADLAAKNVEFSRKADENQKTVEQLAKDAKESADKIVKLEFERKADALVAAGKLLPADRDGTVQTFLESVGVKVQFEGKEISLAEKLYLQFERSAVKVTVNTQKGKANTTEPGTGDSANVSDLNKIKAAYFEGTITATQYKQQVDAWAKKATEISKAGGEVLMSGRERSIVGL